MIDRTHDLPISRQAKALNISRGAVYYKPRSVSPKDLRLMRRIDELHLERPFAGARMLRDFLDREGIPVGRRHVATLMKRMGIEAIYRRPNTSKPTPGHKIYPYRLRSVTVERPNQVWATDITYIPMARGFVYLVAVVDWFSRRVLSHRVSITMEAGFCVEALEEALGKHGKPEIFNSDQGKPVHQRGVHRRPREEPDRHQHGRQRRLARQCVRRAAVEIGEVRGGLPQGLRHRRRGARFAEPVSRLLQSSTPPFEPRPEDAGRGLLRPATLAGRRMKLPPPHRGWNSFVIRPPCVPTPMRQETDQPRQKDTYRRAETVQTNGASSVCKLHIVRALSCGAVDRFDDRLVDRAR
jgi:putative transposase